MKNKLWFRSADDEICELGDDIIRGAHEEGVKEIELIEAVRDKSVDKDYTWCTYYGLPSIRENCVKDMCSCYKPNKSGRGACSHRGTLYVLGEKVSFNVEEEFNKLNK